MRARALVLFAVVSLVTLVTPAADAASSLLEEPGAGNEASGTPAGGASSTGDSPITPRALSQITVLGQRLELEAKIASFVNGITLLENNEGLARWDTPVCPLVSGLPQDEGEFILARFSEIARSAAVPLAGEKCTANLYIFVTARPQQLLQAMERRHHLVVFANASRLDVSELIDTPRPVRVWHHAYGSGPNDAPLRQSRGPDVQILGGSVTTGPTSAPTYHGPGRLGASHLTSNIVWTFSYVYVVADQTKLRGVSRGQFADYVTMVSLAEIKPAAQLGDAQTILRLFAGDPQAAPAGLSDWDQAFLHSLYRTEQVSKLQRSLIAHSMTRQLAH